MAKRRTRKRPKRATAAQIEATARLAARRGALILRRYYEGNVAVRHKGEVDLVTRADLESQEVILGTIRRAFPGHAILAEEDPDSHRQSLDGPIWVVDPLDGTTNYAHGYPMFAISIAFRDQGKTQFGLIYHPLLRELYHAHRGRGARLNGRKIHVSKIDRLTYSLLATGFPYDRRTAQENNLNYFCRFEMSAQCVRRGGSAALDLAYVARGRFDGFWEPKLSAWDIAAGALLVEEAGGQISDYQGKPLLNLWCGEIVGSNRKIHRELLAEIDAVKDVHVHV